ncbi:MAG: hypothetical protein AAF636_21320 [Pseudomonadota bacterium]
MSGFDVAIATKNDVYSDNNKKKNTSLRLSNETLRALKIRAILEDTSVQQIIVTLVEDYLSKTGKK